MIKSYQALGYAELAANTEKVYAENYPESQAQDTAPKPWWKDVGSRAKAGWSRVM
jgi:outer membrane protein assembly factor BamD (BamD/ComL family)